MASDSTDTVFGFILFLLFLAFLGYAAGGISSSSSTAGTTGGTSQSLPPLAGSSVSSCKGTLEKDEPDETHTIQLMVYVDPTDAGTKCATARTTTAGTLKVTLAYTADQTQNVSSTDSCAPGVCTPKASVQVNGTDNFCVSAVAERTGGTTAKVTIPKVVEPCTMRVPAMQPANPPPGLPARSDDTEEEEGY
jgi:hypothetical protein